jgi:cell wall-associated NlpC family hydrolase
VTVTREQCVAEAMSWVGTPYLHQGYVKGLEGGVDCAMINIGVYRDFAKLIAAHYDPRPYPMQWHLHRDEERYLDWFEKHGTRVDRPQLADLVTFKFGRTVSHSGIVVADDVMVHAYRDAGMVIVDNISSYADRIHSYWSIF